MKILAIGDFHGRFPEKLKKEARKADLILSPGDFANADKIRRIIFKNWAGKPWEEVVGLKKAREMQKESFDSGLKIMKELNSLGKKAYFVWGNSDFYRDHLLKENPKLKVGYYNNKIKEIKNLFSVDRKKIKINNLEIIGHGGYVDVTEYIKSKIDGNLKKHKKD
jgi:predicted phosphodiesterase